MKLFSSNKTEEEKLIEGCIAGKRDMQRLLYDLYAKKMMMVGLRYAPTTFEAEDIVQEVLLSIHLKRGTWDPSRPIAPWISTIIRNKLIDSLRRRGRHVDVPLEDVVAVLQIDEQAQAQERLDVDRILKTLKEPQRTIVHAISVEGSSVRETAGRVNMSEGAVRVALHRALKALSLTYRSQ